MIHNSFLKKQNVFARSGLLAGFQPREVFAAYIFLLPAFLGLLVFAFIPFFLAVYFSFTEYNVLSPPKWVGLRNFEKLLYSKVFWAALKNTATYTIGTIPPKMIIGMGLALLMNRKLRGIAVIRAMFYSPVVTAMVAVSVVWLWIYNPNYGLFNAILNKLGIASQLWLIDPKQALPSLMIMGVWKWVGISMVIYLAGLQAIPQEYYEAAAIDGANSWKRFLYVTFPLLAPAHFYLLVTNSISSFQVFEQIFVMTEGGPGFSTTTVVYEIYRQAFQTFKMGYASATAMVLFVIILVLTIINFKFGGGEQDWY